MPFESRRSPLVISPDARETLTALRRSRSEPIARVQRASILLAYADGETVSAIARQMRTNRPKVERCINRALQIGALPSLSDLPGRGRTATISPEAKVWVLALACQKPKELGYAQETWTTSLLASHVRKHCIAVGHPSLADLARGTVSKILTKGEVRPHKITYYLERRDPDFESKMAQVLFV
ncbi:MAG: helix-turn-helix domain-containing protein, partial [Gammaproteobacteria bacterium]